MFNGSNIRRNYLTMDHAAQPREVADDKIDEIVKELSELQENGVRSFINLESYLRWYKNVYGLIALELMIEECREAIKQKKNKELLAIINKLAQMRQQHARYTGEVVDFSAEDDKNVLAPLPGMSADLEELDTEQVQAIIAEYEQYFSELDIESIVNAAAKRNLGEEGFVSFDEIAALIKSVEERLTLLVDAGEITQEKADLIIEMANALDVRRFTDMTLQEQKELITQIATLDVDQVRDLIIEINERELVVTADERLFDEAGFVSFDEMAVLIKSVEERMALLVEAGEITQEKAQVIIDMVNDIDLERFADMSHLEKKELIASIAELDVDQVRDMIIEVNERELVVTADERLFDEAGFVEVGGLSDGSDKKRGFIDVTDVDQPIHNATSPVQQPSSLNDQQAQQAQQLQAREQARRAQIAQQEQQIHAQHQERQRQLQQQVVAQQAQLAQQARHNAQQQQVLQQDASRTVSSSATSLAAATAATVATVTAAAVAATPAATPASPTLAPSVVASPARADNEVFVAIGTREAPGVTPAAPTRQDQTTEFAPDAFMKGPPNFKTESFPQKQTDAALFNQQPGTQKMHHEPQTIQDRAVDAREVVETKSDLFDIRDDHDLPNEPTDGERPDYDKEPTEIVNICNRDCPFRAMCGANKPCAPQVQEQQVSMENTRPPLVRSL